MWEENGALAPRIESYQREGNRLMKRIARLLALGLALVLAWPLGALAASFDPQTTYDEAVKLLEFSLNDPAALSDLYQDFEDLGSFRKSGGYAQYTLALLEISKSSFDGAAARLRTLKDTGFSDALLITQLPTLDALIGYAEARSCEARGEYYDAYQGYVAGDAFDGVSRAANIRSNQAAAMYDEAAAAEANGDLDRAAEIFGFLGSYSDSSQRLASVMGTLSGPRNTVVSSGIELYVVNCYSFVSLRQWPSTSAPALCRIPRLDTVQFVEVYDNSFYLVNYQGMQGYVLSYYLSRDPTNVPRPTPAPAYSVGTRDYPRDTTLYVVNCRESISLRVSPSTSAPAELQIPLGEPVTYKDTMSNGFYKVVYHGHTGYALASYLSDSYWGYGGSGSGYDYGDGLRVVNCNDHISLRTRPDPQASRVTTIPLGDYVTYLGPSSNGFCEVEYNGYTGYALLSYLTRY